MNILQRPLCLVGRHRRDKQAAYRSDLGIYQSVCTGCGVAMWRNTDGWSTQERHESKPWNIDS